MAIKTEQISFRIHKHDKAAIRDAANEGGLSISSFVLGAALSRAQTILLDRQVIEVTPDKHDAFLKKLNEPGAAQRLEALMAIPVPWENKEF